jgi:hypothetical protein
MNKLTALFGEIGARVEFWYWNRDGRPFSNPAVHIHGQEIFSGGGYANKGLIIYYLVFILKVFWLALRFGQGRHFYCLGFATALPVAVAARLSRIRYLYDNNDNISKSHAWPGLLRSVLEFCERFIAAGATLHVVPSMSRWHASDQNLRVIPNVPTTGAVRAAKELIAARGLERGQTLTVYINGLLTGERGLEPLFRTFAEWDGTVPVKVLMAGRILSESARQLSELPFVEYLGVLSNEEALAHYAQAHLTVTFYDPAIEINRLAEPNKWGDCVVMGVPFLVNAEVETARSYLERGACLTVPYHDVSALRALLYRLVKDRSELEQVEVALRGLGWKPWEEYMQAVLGELVNS